jgi:hypothetical protein
MVTDAALSRILQDILALPDIPELESHRLSELCRILNALEGLFVEDPDPSQVGDLCFVHWDYLLICVSAIVCRRLCSVMAQILVFV